MCGYIDQTVTCLKYSKSRVNLQNNIFTISEHLGSAILTIETSDFIWLYDFRLKQSKNVVNELMASLAYRV